MKEHYRILIFGEEHQTLTRLYITLTLQDYEVEATNDRREIIPRFIRQQPRLVIFQQETLPEKEDPIFAQLKERPDTRIMLVGSRAALAKARESGCPADGYLERPVNQEALEEEVRSLLALA